MAQTIKAENLAKVLEKELDDYAYQILLDTQEAAKEAGKEAKKILRAKAPVRTGKYRKSFTISTEKGRLYTRVLVHAKDPHYRLTHLLEFGHAIRNGGRTRAFPHFEPAQEAADDIMMKEIKEAIE